MDGMAGLLAERVLLNNNIGREGYGNVDNLSIVDFPVLSSRHGRPRLDLKSHLCNNNVDTFAEILGIHENMLKEVGFVQYLLFCSVRTLPWS